MKMGVGRRPLYLPIILWFWGLPLSALWKLPASLAQIAWETSIGCHSWCHSLLDVRSKVTFPTWLFRQLGWFHCCVSLESRSQYKVIRCVKENVQFTSLDLVPIWTKAEEAQWLGTTGHRRQVETGKKGQLTHSLTGCQGRCTFRHLIYWFRNYLSPIKTKLNWQFGTNIHPSSNTVQPTFDAKHTDIHEPPLPIKRIQQETLQQKI